MHNVSVIVVCLNEKNNIGLCIESLIEQEYPAEHYEIIVVDNGSADGTIEIVEKYISAGKNIRLIHNPVIGIAGSRNLGISNAAHDLVAFTDADCIAPKEWLKKLVEGYNKYHAKDKQVAGVGGSNVPPTGSARFYDVLHIFLNTYLGSHGSVQGKRFEQDRPVPHLPTVNILLYKPAVIRTGGFDVTFGNIGEDQDLSFRMQRNGFKYFYIKDAIVFHKLRPTFKKWLQNMFLYGKGRAWVMKKYPGKIEPLLFLPALLVFSLLFIFAAVLSAIFLLPLLYFIFILAASLYEAAKCKRPDYFFDLFVLFAGTHIDYGAGQWYGLFKKRQKQYSMYEEIVLNNN